MCEKDEHNVQSMAVSIQVTSEAKIRCTDKFAGGTRNIDCWGRSRHFPLSFLACLEMLYMQVGLEVVCYFGV